MRGHIMIKWEHHTGYANAHDVGWAPGEWPKFTRFSTDDDGNECHFSREDPILSTSMGDNDKVLGYWYVSPNRIFIIKVMT